MDMLNGGLAGKLILFSIPLAFSSILQQLFNSADVAVVGRFAGEQALAAVGSCVALVGIFVNLIVGLSVGPNAALANLIGQKNRGKINSMVHTILTFGAVLGIALLVIGMLVARMVLVASGTPETVLDQALLYIRIYFVGIPFMVAYNFGAAIVRSYGDTRRPMCYLIVSGVLNVILNLLLVIGFHLGVAGVAIATVISNVVSTFLIISHLYRRNDEFSFRFDRMRIDTNELKKVLAIGIPAGIQGAIFSVSNVFIQSGINMFGEAAIAGSCICPGGGYIYKSELWCGQHEEMQKDLLALPALWIRIYGDPQRDLYRVGRFFRQHLYDERCGGGIRDHTNGSCVCLGRFNCDI